MNREGNINKRTERIDRDRRRILKLPVLGALAYSGVNYATENVEAQSISDDQRTSTGKWSQFQKDAGHSGSTTGVSAPKETFTKQWEFSVNHRIPSGTSPVFHDGIVYINTTSFSIDEDPKIYAIDATTGEKMWQIDADSPVIAVTDTALYYAFNGHVTATDPKTGDRMWGREIGDGPFVVTDDILFSSSGYALDPETGDTIWSSDTGYSGLPAADNNTVYATLSGFGSDAGVQALRISDGRVKWESGEKRFGSLTVADNKLLAPAVANTSISAFDTTDGSKVWDNEQIGESAPPPAVTDDTVYIVDSTGDDDLLALSLADGGEKWRFNPGAGFGMVGSPIVVDDTIYAYAFDSSSAPYILTVDPPGSLRDREKLSESGNFGGIAPATADGVLYAPTGKTLHALVGEADDGGSGGNLSPNNPFGDSNGNPVSRRTVIDRIVRWNLSPNNEINGVSFTRRQIINFIVEWNLAS